MTTEEEAEQWGMNAKYA